MAEPEKKSNLPSPGTIFGILLAVGVGIMILATGLDMLGPAINRNTRAILIVVLLAGIIISLTGDKRATRATRNNGNTV